MRKHRKILVLICIVALFLNSIGVANAGTKKPKTYYYWSSGIYNCSGAADWQGLYTNYYFGSAKTYYFDFTNDSSKYDLKIYVYSMRTNRVLDSKVIKPGKRLYWEMNFSDYSEQIYLYFEPPCKFHGTINRKTPNPYSN